MKSVLFVFFAALFLSPHAQAGIHGAYVHHCRLTPASNAAAYPGAGRIVKHNNLALPAGKSIFAPGQRIYITARVYDRDCVPLDGAKVEIWQTNPEGRFVRPDKGAFTNPYPLFAGSGMAIADNKGVFAFISTFPGPYTIYYNKQKRLRAPHISMRITHPRFARPYSVDMYFERDARNAGDPYFQQYKAVQRPLIEATVVPRDEYDINAGMQVYFDITLPETDPFRQH